MTTDELRVLLDPHLPAVKEVFGSDPWVVNYGYAAPYKENEPGFHVLYRRKPHNFDYLKSITSVGGIPVKVTYMGPIAPLGGPV